MNPLVRIRLTVAAVALACILSAANRAAAISYTFVGAFDSGPLDGDGYSGSLTFDDTGLTGIGDESVPLDAFALTWMGPQLAGALGIGDADFPPEAIFYDGTFLGIDAIFTSGDPVLSFLAGTDDTSDAFIAYDVVSPTVGAGAGDIFFTVQSAPPSSGVPEPTTVVLGGLAMVLLGRRRRCRARGFVIRPNV